MMKRIAHAVAFGAVSGVVYFAHAVNTLADLPVRLYEWGTE